MAAPIRFHVKVVHPSMFVLLEEETQQQKTSSYWAMTLKLKRLLTRVKQTGFWSLIAHKYMHHIGWWVWEWGKQN